MRTPSIMSVITATTLARIAPQAMIASFVMNTTTTAPSSMVLPASAWTTTMKTLLPLFASTVATSSPTVKTVFITLPTIQLMLVQEPFSLVVLNVKMGTSWKTCSAIHLLHAQEQLC